MALFLSNLGAAGIILTIAVMLASGFLLTRFTKRLHLPNVTGYIIAGVIIGPWCLNLVPSQYIEQMDFITDLALAFIAFGVGKYFKLSSLKANGKNMVILTLFESLTAGVLHHNCYAAYGVIPVLQSASGRHRLRHGPGLHHYDHPPVQGQRAILWTPSCRWLPWTTQWP